MTLVGCPLIIVCSRGTLPNPKPGRQELTLRPYTKGLEDRPEVAPILEGVTHFSGG